jgi:hypothetical protein
MKLGKCLSSAGHFALIAGSTLVIRKSRLVAFVTDVTDVNNISIMQHSLGFCKLNSGRAFHTSRPVQALSLCWLHKDE